MYFGDETGMNVACLRHPMAQLKNKFRNILS